MRSAHRPDITLVAFLVGSITIAELPAGAAVQRVPPPTLVATAPLMNLNDVAFDDKHNVYLHVWGISPNVSGRFVGLDGNPVGPPFQISTADFQYGQHPRVAYSSGVLDDVFLVVFSSDNRGPGTLNVFGQLVRFTGTGGTLVGSIFPISIHSLNPSVSQYAGGVTFNRLTRQFLVTWGGTSPGLDFDVHARIFDVNGTPVTGDINLTPEIPGWQGAPNAAFDPRTNRYLVTWQGESAGVIGSWVKILDGPTGAPLTGVITLSTGGFQAEQNVIYLPQPGLFLVCWTDIQPSFIDVSGRLVDPNGALVSGIFPVVGTPPFDGTPDGDYSPSTRTALVGATHDSGFAWAAELNASGQPISTFQGSTVPPRPGGGTFYPRVAAGSNGHFALAYVLDHNSARIERFRGTPNRAPFDADGDGKTDRTIFRPANGTWYELRSGGGAVARQWGELTDRDVPGDYDGDGRLDHAVWRPSAGRWFILQSGSGTATAVQWGESGDVPLAGDVDGDGKDDLVVWRPGGGLFFALRSTGGGTVHQWGEASDVPLLGDWDGDLRADLGVWRPSTGVWYVLRSTGGSDAVQWGGTGDVPMVGDWDGDGRSDFGVWRPSNGVWFVRRATGGTDATQWGEPGDVPVVGDWDGDGRTDFGIWRPGPGVWFTLQSTGGGSMVRWGETGDRPIGRRQGS